MVGLTLTKICVLPTYCNYGVRLILSINIDYFLNSISQLAIVKQIQCSVREAGLRFLNRPVILMNVMLQRAK
jgi:hypothetical protein